MNSVNTTDNNSSTSQLKQITSQLKASVHEFWDARQPRERQYLSVAGVVILATLIYLIAIDPALTEGETLKKSLPTLHQQVALMRQYSQQMSVLPSAENRHEVTRDMVEMDLAHNNLKPQTLSVNEGVVRAQLTGVALSSIQAWLLEMQKSSSLFVEEIKITSTDATNNGLVSANVVLRQPTQAN